MLMKGGETQGEAPGGGHAEDFSEISKMLKPDVHVTVCSVITVFAFTLSIRLANLKTPNCPSGDHLHSVMTLAALLLVINTKK